MELIYIRGISMKKKIKLIKIAALVATLSLAKFAVAAPENQTQPNDITKHITVVNNSSVPLVPTSEGVERGCLGGNIPDFLNPIRPNKSAEIKVTFIQYLPSCRFNVLPYPNIVTLLQGCRQVKDGDTVTFTGSDYPSLRCKVG